MLRSRAATPAGAAAFCLPVPACPWGMFRVCLRAVYIRRGRTGRDGTVSRSSVSGPGGGWPLCVCRGRRAGERAAHRARRGLRGGCRLFCGTGHLLGLRLILCCHLADRGGEGRLSRVCLRGYLAGAGDPAPVVSRRGKAVPRLLFGRSGRGRNGCPAPACNCAADRAFCTCLRSRGGEGRALRGRKPLRFQLLRLAALRRFRYSVGGTPYEQKSRPRCAGAGRKERTT